VPAPPSTLVGQTLGSFQVTGTLGEGGMGQVYRAEHVLIGRKAAIKVLSSEVASDPDVVARFFNEARAVNDIRHPNIVEVTDFGHIGSVPYIVMEMLEGETLEERLARVGPLDPATTARILAQVTSALGAAHEHGMVHRDLKPANIFLCRHPDYPDFVKILDFGIAKLTALHGQSTENKTACGAIIGTPAYMSPEQCLGDTNLDFRSDIYSLGVVLYQMLTGRRPFDAEAAGRLIMCHVQSPPPAPCSINPKLPASVGAVILRALEKQRERRFANMRELRDAFVSAVATSSVGPVLPANQISYTPAPVVVGTVAPTVGTVAPTVAAAPARNPTMAIGATMLSGLPTVPGATPAPVVVARSTPVPATGTMVRPRPAPTPTPSAERVNKQMLCERLVDIVRSRITSHSLPIPQLSPRVLRALDLATEADFSFGSMAALLGEEARLSARVVQVANSSGPARLQAHNVEQAIRRLGAAGLRTTLLEISARPLLDTREPRLADLFKQPFVHALAVGLLAQRLMQTHGSGEAEAAEAFHAGLLHDSGKPVVGAMLLDVERQMASTKARRLVSDDVMVTCIEQTYAKASAQVAAGWQLSHKAAQAIERADHEVTPGWSLAHALRLADALAAQEGFHLRREDIDRAPAIIDEVSRAAALGDDSLAKVVAGIRDAVARRG
jgi:serine/threonine protein kinase/HD-like signal output (HDOD) protein